MKSLTRIVVVVSLLWFLIALPAFGQISNMLTFETTFPFYAGNAKMPAGSYRVSPAEQSESLLLIESANGSHFAFLEVDPTTSETPHPQSDVTFKKYGNVDYLNLLWVRGQTYGMQAIPSRSEQLAAKTAAATQHSLPLQSGR